MARPAAREGGWERCLSTRPPGQSESGRSLPLPSTRRSDQSKAHDSPTCSGIGGAGAPHVLLTGAPGGAAPPLPGRPSAGLETWLFPRVGRAGPAARTTRRAGRRGGRVKAPSGAKWTRRAGTAEGARPRRVSPGGLRERRPRRGPAYAARYPHQHIEALLRCP